QDLDQERYAPAASARVPGSGHHRPGRDKRGVGEGSRPATMRFDGTSVIVTGAGSGFGEAIATRFAREGARVVVADVNEENGRRVAAAIGDEGGTARFVHTDVSRAADVKTMVETAVSAFGRLDVLVNNAGFSHRMTPLWDL